jgi:hypothetical protein
LVGAEFQLPEEIGWTGFLQNRWHLPDFFVDEGFGIEQIVIAPAFRAFEFVSWSSLAF